jgi:putative ATP-dependent endonuclease of the OLD family
MRIRHLNIERFRGIRELAFCPGPTTIILGPNNAGKSSVLEALDLLLHSGLGRTRPSPTEIDYYSRDPSAGFAIEAVIGGLPVDFVAQVHEHLEGWNSADELVVPEPDGEGIEPVIRIRVRGTQDFDVLHEFAKEESGGARFSPGLRARIAWIFDGRARDPARQLAFYQGGLLDRLFGEVNLDPAVTQLKTALGNGAGAVNSDENVGGVLKLLGGDLRSLGLASASEIPQFEVGAVSARELLQALRLALPGAEVQIPVIRQGRGVQRLLLVSILLRLAQSGENPAIGGFEEPEEALEPLRQTQIAKMLAQIVGRGGQVFVVTHSPEVARAFSIDDFLLLEERSAGGGARQLRKSLSVPVRQKYERWLDGSVVRALFARIPLLVEGPGDRAVVETFWRALATPPEEELDQQPTNQTESEGPMVIPAAEKLGLDVVNCEGAPNMPMMARLLKEAGKTIVAWVEQDVQDILGRLLQGGHVDAYLLHDATPGKQNLEQALAQNASLPALIRALEQLANGRDYDWEKQRYFLVSAAEGVKDETREAMKASDNLDELFEALADGEARALIARALAAREVAPFEMKGARQARIVAETIVEVDGGIPEPFARALKGLALWIAEGCEPVKEISMS